MFIEEPLPFIKDFINELDLSLRESGENNYLSRIQRYWIGFCIVSILLTNSVCWARFERFSLKGYSQAALSWMFRKSKLPWEAILVGSVRVILKNYQIKEGHIVLDDSENGRSKNAKKLHKLHKIKDKKTGGYILGQSLVLLVLVTDKITFPIGFAFYAPDPAIKEWGKQEKVLQKKGIKKRNRPSKPSRNKDYPKKEDIALRLLADFRLAFPMIKILSISADALYGTDNFMEKASSIFGKTQVISQLRKNQLVWQDNKWVNLTSLFLLKPFYVQKMLLRGKEVEVSYSYITVKVKAHDGKKRKIIALKYEDEEEYRYLVATDTSWVAQSIIQSYALRWLVEVFFQDWKSYEGWGQLAKHTGFDGSNRGLILSLLLDHCLLLHPEQKAQIKDKLPAFTVGSLREKIIVENFIVFIKSLIKDENPQAKLKKLAENADIIFQGNPSSKHMNTVNIEYEGVVNAA